LQDFDIGRHENLNKDRQFRIGGEDFTFRGTLAAERLSQYVDATSGESFVRILETADQLILSVLDPGQDEKWAKVRAADAQLPLTLREIQDVCSHLISVTAGRPTQSPSGSSVTSLRPGTSSTDTSASAEGTG
jgi:hypothetical protein